MAARGALGGMSAAVSERYAARFPARETSGRSAGPVNIRHAAARRAGAQGRGSAVGEAADAEEVSGRQSGIKL
jgi:hypothetical protein